MNAATQKQFEDELELLVADLQRDLEEGEELDLTVGVDPKTGRWGFQTGDNSFHGGAYAYPVWLTATVVDWVFPNEVVSVLLDSFPCYEDLT